MLAYAYLFNKFYGVMDNIKTKDSEEAINFIWNNLQCGYYCTLQYIDNGIVRYFSPDFFDENTMDISDCEIELL